MIQALVITGPTATGKTRLAVQLSREFHGEILSADSRQVYRGMDIGTGKDLEEYSDGGASVPVHLLDIVLPTEEFHLFSYLERAKQALGEIAARQAMPVITGGTPLYLQAMLHGYHHDGGAPDLEARAIWEESSLENLVEQLRKTASPELFARTDLTQKRRVMRALELARTGITVTPDPLLDSPLILAPYFPRKTVRERILQRLKFRMEHGLPEEVQALHDGTSGLPPVPWEKMEWFGLEYRYMARYLQGKLSREETILQLHQQICQFAKHQDIWFRRFERDGFPIHWLPEGDPSLARQLVALWRAGEPLPPPVLRLNDIHYDKSFYA